MCFKYSLCQNCKRLEVDHLDEMVPTRGLRAKTYLYRQISGLIGKAR